MFGANWGLLIKLHHSTISRKQVRQRQNCSDFKDFWNNQKKYNTEEQTERLRTMLQHDAMMEFIFKT